MGARGDHPTLNVLDMHDSIAVDAEWPQACPLQLLTGHRLDRISPDLHDLHHHLHFPLTCQPNNEPDKRPAAFRPCPLQAVRPLLNLILFPCAAGRSRDIHCMYASM